MRNPHTDIAKTVSLLAVVAGSLFVEVLIRVRLEVLVDAQLEHFGVDQHLTHIWDIDRLHFPKQRRFCTAINEFLSEYQWILEH